MDLWMWELDISDREKILPIVFELAEQVEPKHGVHIRKMTRRSLRRDMDRFAEVYNSAWAQQLGLLAATPRRTSTTTPRRCSSSSTRPWFMVAEKDGETVAVAITVPDINQVLSKMNGRLLPFGWWHFLRRRKIIDRCRVGFLGVKPEYQHTGVAAALYVEHFDLAARTPVTWGEMGWILETNRADEPRDGGHERPQGQDLPGLPAHAGLTDGARGVGRRGYDRPGWRKRTSPTASKRSTPSRSWPTTHGRCSAPTPPPASSWSSRPRPSPRRPSPPAWSPSPPSAERAPSAPGAARGARRNQLAPVLATRSFLIDVHLLGSRD